MNEIICPNCKRAFKIDEAGYAEIINQVRTREFEIELKKREEGFEKQIHDAVLLAEERTKSSLNQTLNEKDKEIITLKSKKEEEFLKLKSQKESELSELKAKLNSYETEKELAITKALNEIEREKERLFSELETERRTKTIELQNLESTIKNRFTDELKLKDAQLKDKDDLIERYKDMKAKLSTKMLGETLEQHCEIEFNKIRAMAFPKAYFEKDNDASKGTKGDYIFREKDEDGNEVVSIMFEMKNESDTTSNKKKNDDFLKKLHEDRTEKKCEYAVLVTLLESENELYNSGIVDLSYKYQKMYVIRPQFFIPMITLIRNASLNAMKYKTELQKVKNQNIDVTNFENELTIFKEGFSKRYKHASDRFKDAIKEIDESIKRLQLVKENLLTSEDHLRCNS
jgi:hypothetical protein